MSDVTGLAQEHGLLVPTGIGAYGWGAELERVFHGLQRMLSWLGRTPDTRVLRFPPVIDRRTFERSEFAHSFPQLFGAVHAFTGDRAAHEGLTRAMAEGADWGGATGLTDYVLTPAACYPVYPLYAGGQLPDTGATVDVSSYCFRHEPSAEPGRLVAFRQQELVRIADQATVEAWFAECRRWSVETIRALGLDGRLAAASDPFFGRGGWLLANSQREQDLKCEVVAPIGDHPVAVASCNQHRDHFGRSFGIRCADGSVAHTGCIGFGLERIALSLLTAHGPAIDRWPAAVREVLWT